MLNTVQPVIPLVVLAKTRLRLVALLAKTQTHHQALPPAVRAMLATFPIQPLPIAKIVMPHVPLVMVICPRTVSLVKIATPRFQQLKIVCAIASSTPIPPQLAAGAVVLCAITAMGALAQTALLVQA